MIITVEAIAMNSKGASSVRRFTRLRGLRNNPVRTWNTTTTSSQGDEKGRLSRWRASLERARRPACSRVTGGLAVGVAARSGLLTAAPRPRTDDRANDFLLVGPARLEDLRHFAEPQHDHDVRDAKTSRRLCEMTSTAVPRPAAAP